MFQALNETMAALAAMSFTIVRRTQAPQQHSRLDDQTKESESVKAEIILFVAFIARLQSSSEPRTNLHDADRWGTAS